MIFQQAMLVMQSPHQRLRPYSGHQADCDTHFLHSERQHRLKSQSRPKDAHHQERPMRQHTKLCIFAPTCTVLQGCSTQFLLSWGSSAATSRAFGSLGRALGQRSAARSSGPSSSVERRRRLKLKGTRADVRPMCVVGFGRRNVSLSVILDAFEAEGFEHHITYAGHQNDPAVPGGGCVRSLDP